MGQGCWPRSSRRGAAQQAAGEPPPQQLSQAPATATQAQTAPEQQVQEAAAFAASDQAGQPAQQPGVQAGQPQRVLVVCDALKQHGLLGCLTNAQVAVGDTRVDESLVLAKLDAPAASQDLQVQPRPVAQGPSPCCCMRAWPGLRLRLGVGPRPRAGSSALPSLCKGAPLQRRACLQVRWSLSAPSATAAAGCGQP